MAAVKTSNSDGHFSVERLKEWPEPESVSLMEMLAREDIDEAVYAILFRENYIVKVSGCTLRSGGARADVMLCRREGKQNDAQKEHTKETRKAPHFGRSPQFMHASHGIVPKEKPRAPPRFEKPVCKSKSYLPQEETPDLSQLAFERQFRSSKLRPENKEIEKCLVSCGLGVGLGGYPRHRTASPGAWQSPSPQQGDGWGSGAQFLMGAEQRRDSETQCLWVPEYKCRPVFTR
uniref:Protein FAM228A n=1 Tax=Peromyscus maniculatus bairdii TaxID=230844 RepID=A0A8C8W6V9_PERMB